MPLVSGAHHSRFERLTLRNPPALPEDPLVAKAKRELNTKERAALASELLESLDYPGEPVSAEEAADAWLRRAERVVRGALTGVPAEKVHAAIRRKLRTRR